MSAVQHGQDSAGQPITVGDRVRWRGQLYTIKAFGKAVGRFGTRTITFAEPPHLTNEVPDEMAVDLIKGAADRSYCCAAECSEPLKHAALPFCPEHLKDEALIRAWMEL